MKSMIKRILLTVMLACTMVLSMIPVSADGGNVTWSDVFQFIDDNFSDIAFQDVVKREVENYYSWDGDNDETVVNETDVGPEVFGTPEEALSWIGAFEVNTKTDGITNVDGLQYIGKEYFLDTGDTEVYLTLDGGICLQELFGELWTNKTELYCKISSWSTGYIKGCLSEDGYLGNLNDVTIPPFAPGFSFSIPRDNSTKKTALVYLRDGEEKRISVYGNVFRHTSKQDLTSVGKTVKTKIPASIVLKDPTDKKWELISAGADESDIRWKLQFASWDMLLINAMDGLSALSVPYDYAYRLQMEYYSSVDIKLDSEIYGGFTYTKVSENDKNIKLSGAEFVVSNEKGEYLVSEGTTDTPAVFDADITKAKIYTTDDNGLFKVEKIPVGKPENGENEKVTATYYVTEIKAASGYRLDSTAKKVSVTASVKGIQMSHTGGENGVTINSDDIELTPQWENGVNKPLVLSDGRETKNEKHTPATKHDMYIKNGGKKITTVKYETDNDRLETLQAPDITVKDLAGKTVGTANSLNDMKALLNGLITDKKMETVTDSYNVVSTKSIIYYDKDSVEANSNVSLGNDEYQMSNATLPVNIKLDATKTMKGAALSDGDFEFRLEPEAGNPNDDPFKDGKTVTNDGKGNIDFGKAQFTKAGTYKYTLKETDGGTLGKQEDIAYDKTVRNIEIEVKETGKDGLTAVVRITQDGKTEEKEYTSTQTNEVSYPHLTGNTIQNDQISQTVADKYEDVSTTEFVNTKETPSQPEEPKDEDKKPEESKDNNTKKEEIVETKTGDSEKNTNNVKTGDSAQLEKYMAVALLSVMIMVLIIVRKKIMRY